MEEIERAWFYDDSVTPTKVLVRAEERAVLRKGPRRQKKQRAAERSIFARPRLDPESSKGLHTTDRADLRHEEEITGRAIGEEAAG